MDTPIYREKDATWFAGTPEIRPPENVGTKFERIRVPSRGKREPFLDKYEIVIDIETKCAAVYDGKKKIASHDWLTGTAVGTISDKQYLRKGIASNLIAVCALRDPGQRHSKVRNQAGHNAYLAAWKIIQGGL